MDDRLPECDLDVVDLNLRKNSLAADGHNLGVVLGITPTKKKETSFLGEADRVNACPLDGDRSKVLLDPST